MLLIFINIFRLPHHIVTANFLSLGMQNEFINNLIEALQSTLPGTEAHRKLAPPGRELIAPDYKINSIQKSGVLFLLFPVNDRIFTCLIKRPSSMKHHPGQIGFPGGKVEKEDIDAKATAIREAEEEVGLIPGSYSILGRLSDLYVPVSNFIIYPFIAWSNHQPRFTCEPGEVEEILLFPVQDFIESEQLHYTEIQTVTGLLQVPYYPFSGDMVWGATAMILSEFIEMAKHYLPVQE